MVSPTLGFTEYLLSTYSKHLLELVVKGSVWVPAVDLQVTGLSNQVRFLFEGYVPQTGFSSRVELFKRHIESPSRCIRMSEREFAGPEVITWR